MCTLTLLLFILMRFYKYSCQNTNCGSSSEYFSAQQGKCFSCSTAVTNCKSCEEKSNKLLCLECDKGYGLQSDLNRCVDCAANNLHDCQECEINEYSSWKCTICTEGLLPMYPDFVKCNECIGDDVLVHEDANNPFCVKIPLIIDEDPQIITIKGNDTTTNLLTLVDVCSPDLTLVYMFRPMSFADYWDSIFFAPPEFPSPTEIISNYSLNPNQTWENGYYYMKKDNLQGITDLIIPVGMNFFLVKYCINQFHDASKQSVSLVNSRQALYYILIYVAKLFNKAQTNNITCILQDHLRETYNMSVLLVKNTNLGVFCSNLSEKAPFNISKNKNLNFLQIFQVLSENYTFQHPNIESNFKIDISHLLFNKLNPTLGILSSNDFCVSTVFCCQVPTVIPGISNAFIRLDLKKSVLIHDTIPDKDSCLHYIFYFGYVPTDLDKGQDIPTFQQLREGLNSKNESTILIRQTYYFSTDLATTLHEISDLEPNTLYNLYYVSVPISLDFTLVSEVAKVQFKTKLYVAGFLLKHSPIWVLVCISIAFWMF